MPSSDINQLNSLVTLPQSISRLLISNIRNPPNFGPVQRQYQHGYANPTMQLGANGSWLDPSQTNLINATNMLGERSDIASQNQQDKAGYASNLQNAGSIIARIINMIPYLQAQNLSGGGGFLGGII